MPPALPKRRRGASCSRATPPRSPPDASCAAPIAVRTRSASIVAASNPVRRKRNRTSPRKRSTAISPAIGCSSGSKRARHASLMPDATRPILSPGHDAVRPALHERPDFDLRGRGLELQLTREGISDEDDLQALRNSGRRTSKRPARLPRVARVRDRCRTYCHHCDRIGCGTYVLTHLWRTLSSSRW